MIPVVLTALAEDDLDRIADYYADKSPAFAKSIVITLRAFCQSLDTMPLRYPMRGDLPDGMRLASVRGYIVLYTAHDQHVVIERIIHGARDLPDLL